MPDTHQFIALGEVNENSQTRLFTAQFNIAGELQTNWADQGIQVFSLDGYEILEAVDIKIQSNGKIVILGNTHHLDDFQNAQWFVYRLNSDGTLDETFGQNGKKILDAAYDTDEASRLLLDDQDRMIILGTTWSKPSAKDKVKQSYSSLAITRLDSNGNIDPTYLPDQENQASFNYYQWGDGHKLFDAIFDQSQRLVIALEVLDYGLSENQFTGPILIRLDENGTLDTSFNQDGILEVPYQITHAIRLAEQNDGKMILCGSTLINNTKNMRMIRLDTQGEIDSSFGLDGVITETDTSNHEPHTLMIDDQGRILVGGSLWTDSYRGTFMYRYGI